MFRNLFGHNARKNKMHAEELEQRLASGESLVLLDVRQPGEYAEAHLPGSILIPLPDLAQRIGELPKDRPIVAMCRSGNRSKVAVSLLQRAGVADVYNLEGGILDWTKKNLPVTRGK